MFRVHAHVYALLVGRITYLSVLVNANFSVIVVNCRALLYCITQTKPNEAQIYVCMYLEYCISLCSGFQIFLCHAMLMI